MVTLKDTPAWAIIGGIAGGGAGLLTGIDPLMLAGSLALSAVAIGAAISGQGEEAPIAATRPLDQHEPPLDAEACPGIEQELPRSSGRFQEMVTMRRATLRQRF